jgi:hypothetical protein
VQAPTKRAEAVTSTLIQIRPGRRSNINPMEMDLTMASHITARPDRAIYLEPSPFGSDGGTMIGRHPRDIAINELRALPTPQSPLKAIRARCMDCCGETPPKSGSVLRCFAPFGHTAWASGPTMPGAASPNSRRA